LAREIVVVRTQIDAWRQRKKGGEGIPAPLWEAAVALAGDHSVYEVSRGLGLDYGKLKRLVSGAAQRHVEPEPEPETEFVELAGLFETRRAAIVEMRRGDGASIRVELPEDKVDVVELAMALWWGSA
jgi:hypothetical protein